VPRSKGLARRPKGKPNLEIIFLENQGENPNTFLLILCHIGNFRSIKDHFTFIGMTIPMNIFYFNSSFFIKRKLFEYGTYSNRKSGSMP
jgi:hypothetical protein